MRTFLVAAAAMAFGISKAQNCDPSYECKYHYQTSRHLWYYDFTASCVDGTFGQWVDPYRNDDMTYYFELCGTVQQSCNGGQIELGTAIQTYTGADGEDCQVIGHGAPLYSPWPQSNQDIPPGGIDISFLGQAVDENSPTACPPDPVSGVRNGRQIVFKIACDPSKDILYIKKQNQSIAEGPTCFYTAYASSKMACAVRYTGPDASADATGDPDQVIGLDGGSAFGCVVGGAAIAFVVWAGIGYARTGKLPFVSGGGSSGSFGTGLTVGSPAAAKPSFGGTSGVGAGGGYGQVA